MRSLKQPNNEVITTFVVCYYAPSIAKGEAIYKEGKENCSACPKGTKCYKKLSLCA
jgi:hypothetical protein